MPDIRSILNGSGVIHTCMSDQYFSLPHIVWLDSTGLHRTDQTHLNLCLNCNESGGVRWSPPDWTGLLLNFFNGNRVLGLTRLQSSLPSPVESTGLESPADWTGLHWTMKKSKSCPDQLNGKTNLLRHRTTVCRSPLESNWIMWGRDKDS